MNFLTHLLLDHASPGRMIGSILPDLVRPIDWAMLDADVADAARRHRRVDALVDTHPLHLAARARLRGAHGHFAAILVDVFYDHVLAIEFERYAGRSLDGFVTQVYQTFESHGHLMPNPMPTITRRMTEQDWLGSYATLDGMVARLTQMAARFEAKFGRTFDVRRAVADLRNDQGILSDELDQLMPLLY